MSAVVADTGPLNYLVLIDQVGILPALFGSVAIPEVVLAELTHPETPAALRVWISTPPSWLVVRPDAIERDADLQSLDSGECGAITLVASLDAKLILMDDRAAVAIARRRGFAVAGTIGLLDLAARRGLLDLSTAFERLRRTSFRCRPELLDMVLAKHRTKR